MKKIIIKDLEEQAVRREVNIYNGKNSVDRTAEFFCKQPTNILQPVTNYLVILYNKR